MTDAPEAPTTEPTTEEQPVETDWKAEAERLKSEARKWESRSKDNAKAAQRLAEIEEASKTELQRFQERAEAAEKQLQSIQSEQQVMSWRAEVAEKSGVPANLLRGSSLEELQAHADELAPVLTNANRGPRVPSPGNIPDNPVSDDAAWFRGVLGGQ